jgi:transcriptional regulator with XRE-family HTH domain
VKKKEDTGFGAKLKSLREARSMTQQQLADAAGMNKFGLAKLEQGVTEPYWPTVVKLATALGVDCTAFAVAPPLPVTSPAPTGAPVTAAPKGKTNTGKGKK